MELSCMYWTATGDLLRIDIHHHKTILPRRVSQRHPGRVRNSIKTFLDARQTSSRGDGDDGYGFSKRVAATSHSAWHFDRGGRTRSGGSSSATSTWRRTCRIL